MKKSYTEYEQVPWFRKSSVVSPMVLCALLLHIGLGVLGIIAVPIALLPWAACIIALTGGVYNKKKDASGNLKSWGIGNKIAAIILLILSTLWIINTVAPHTVGP